MLNYCKVKDFVHLVKQGFFYQNILKYKIFVAESEIIENVEKSYLFNLPPCCIYFLSTFATFNSFPTFAA